MVSQVYMRSWCQEKSNEYPAAIFQNARPDYADQSHFLRSRIGSYHPPHLRKVKTKWTAELLRSPSSALSDTSGLSWLFFLNAHFSMSNDGTFL